MDYFDILLAKKLNGGCTNAIYKQTLSNLPQSIATFTGADAPIDSLKASIEGVQDLHGYDSPWPAGGGKNKLEVTGTSTTVSGVTFTVKSDGSVLVNGTATADIAFTLNATVPLTAGTWIFGLPSNSLNNDFRFRFFDGNWFAVTTSEVSRTLSADTSCGAQIAINSGVTVNNVTIYPMIRATETDASFVPYSNICPISGWSSCDVTVTDDLIDPTYTNTYTIPFKDSSDNPITVYGGVIDVSGGKFTVTHANIASYNGETINEPWISSEDVYTQGATPTTGAQVVYPLITPLVYEFNPIALRSNGVTNISVNCGEVTELKYYSDTP